MKDNIEKLAGIVEITRGRFDRLTVLRDFFEVIALAISNCFDPVHLAERRDRAAKVYAKYTENERAKLDEYFSTLAEICQHNLRFGYCPDLLGRLYEKYGHNSKEQEMTPDGISKICNRIVLQPEKQIAERGFVTLADLTCGSGGLFLQGAELMIREGYDITSQLEVFANDVNPRCVHMAYIQASLYGIPAVISQTDIFPLQEADRWYTPTFISGDWVWRNPLNHTTARNRDDEMLKMMTHPMYAAIRRIEGWPERRNNPHD